MKSKGKLISLTRDLDDRYILTLSVDTDIREEFNKLFETDIQIEISKFRQKRSLDANAYFHKLVELIAEKQGISKIRCKNMMICQYGQIEYVDGEVAVIKTNVQPEQMCEQEFLHCQPCKVSIENGKEVIFYRVYRGTHTYDSHEMSKLIEGTVFDAKELGIETMTPNELERMMQLYAKKCNR